jgi:hypothetical protein
MRDRGLLFDRALLPEEDIDKVLEAIWHIVTSTVKAGEG